MVQFYWLNVYKNDNSELKGCAFNGKKDNIAWRKVGRICSLWWSSECRLMESGLQPQESDLATGTFFYIISAMQSSRLRRLTHRRWLIIKKKIDSLFIILSLL